MECGVLRSSVRRSTFVPKFWARVLGTPFYVPLHFFPPRELYYSAAITNVVLGEEKMVFINQVVEGFLENSWDIFCSLE